MSKRSAEAMMMMMASPSTSSQQQLKPEKRIRQSSSLSETTNSILVSQIRASRTNCGNNMNNLPKEMFERILRKLDTNEQCKFRAVSRTFKIRINKMFALKRCLKMNFTCANKGRKKKQNYHKWAPAVSIQSLQFDSNWTEPKMEMYKKAHVTVQENHFNKVTAEALARLFSRVHYLVIYFDLNPSNEKYENFINMIKNFKMLESFSLIRNKPLRDYYYFIPKLWAPLEALSPFRRLEIYVEQNYDADHCLKDDKMLPLAVKSLELLENFALSSWSPDTKREYQHSILQYAGELLKDARQVFKSKPLELTSLCIPVNVYNFEVKTCLNLVQVINSNAELQNVKRLQLTEVKSIDEVKSALPLFSKLQSLVLYMFNDAMKIKTDAYIEMINQCNHLTELKIFGGCWTPFEAGPCAPQVRKFTMAANSLFDRFMEMLYGRGDEQNEEQNDESVNEPDEIQVQMRGWYQGRFTFNQVANEFVRLVTLKIPSLEELTILTDENTMEYSNSREGWLVLKDMIIKKLRAKSDNLKLINIEMFHVIYQ